MQDHNQTSGASIPPLRAEPRIITRDGQDPHIRGVEASSGSLAFATLGSALAAGTILVFFWLPAEYGIDATGLGRAMGLTQMGEIKQQLYAEAAAEDAALAAQSATPPAAPVNDPQMNERLAAIERQLAEIAASVRAGAATQDVRRAESAPAATETPEAEVAAVAPVEPAETVEDTAPVAAATPSWRDEVSYTLSPGEGIELKLAMQEGAIAEFEWTANGAVLNHDTHGDGSGRKISYEQGRNVPGQQGELVAAFTGNHGWFWRNRTEVPVTFTLRTRGDYSELRKP